MPRTEHQDCPVKTAEGCDGWRREDKRAVLKVLPTYWDLSNESTLCC